MSVTLEMYSPLIPKEEVKKAAKNGKKRENMG
jgi:hypothetical protein